MAQLNSRLTIPVGETIFGPVQAPDPVTWLEIRLDRNNWGVVGSDLVHVSIQVSADGVTYKEVGAFTADGGVKRTGYSSQRINFNPTLPMGTWVRAVTTATTPLDTRALVLWG